MVVGERFRHLFNRIKFHQALFPGTTSSEVFLVNCSAQVSLIFFRVDTERGTNLTVKRFLVYASDLRFCASQS